MFSSTVSHHQTQVSSRNLFAQGRQPLTCKGGETPINNSIVLYRRLKENHPEFIEEIEKKVCIHKILPSYQVQSSNLSMM